MKTADPELMRAINRYLVMDAIRRRGGVARVEISEMTELSPTTVSAITAALLEDGLIVPRHVDPPADQPRGRPRTMLELNAKAAFVCGAKLAPDQITVAVTDFQADVLNRLTVPIRVDRQPAAVVLDLVEDGIRRCAHDAGIEPSSLSGICVGLPGIVERTSGICRYTPLFRERDIAFGDALQSRLDVPTIVDSDVNLVTMAEHWFGLGRDLDDFLVVSLEHTIGLGILHGGDLFRGAHGMSPDFGDLLVADPRAGREARLSAIASTTAMLGRAVALALGTPDEAALRGGRGADRLFALAREQGGAYAAIVGEAGRALGVAIGNLITLFAPPKVIVSGSGLRAGALLTEPLREALRTTTPPDIERNVDVVFHQASDDLWAQGAAALMLRDLYGAPWTTTGPAKRLAASLRAVNGHGQ